MNLRNLMQTDTLLMFIQKVRSIKNSDELKNEICIKSKAMYIVGFWIAILPPSPVRCSLTVVRA
jgi:hypothetical protein